MPRGNREDWGGARTPRDPAKAKKRGPLLKRVSLPDETAREIKIVLLAAGKPYTVESVVALIGEWSRAAWVDYEASIAPSGAEWEGEVL